MRPEALAALFVWLSTPLAGTAAGLPDGFVWLSEVAPTIVEDIRYAGSNNFTGSPVPGYEFPACILARPVAEALAGVQSDLAPEGLTLIALDCYRPARAVRHFAEWVGNGGDNLDGQYHPRTARSRLTTEGYIAARSGHSSGGSVDVSLARRLSDSSHQPLDMGGIFDLFDPASAANASDVSVAARANRARLARAMQAHGFTPYAREWWHFRFKDEPHRGKAFDFPVTGAK